MKRTFRVLALVTLTLAGCIEVPAWPVYDRPAPVVIY